MVIREIINTLMNALIRIIYNDVSKRVATSGWNLDRKSFGHARKTKYSDGCDKVVFVMENVDKQKKFAKFLQDLKKI